MRLDGPIDVETAATGGTVVSTGWDQRPFALNYARPAVSPLTVVPYAYDPLRQLNVLPDGRPAISDRDLLLACGTTTSTAGSQTHFDD